VADYFDNIKDGGLNFRQSVLQDPLQFLTEDSTGARKMLGLTVMKQWFKKPE